jgi:cbb3-type cytochrome oxidase subunit 1
MGIWFLRIAVLYLVFGVIFGFVMGISEKVQFASVHAHINLLGWATLALAGIIYTLFPGAGNNRLAAVHFWLHNIGLPIFLIGLYLVAAGHVLVPVLSAGATIAIVGIILFAINVLLNVRSRAAA